MDKLQSIFDKFQAELSEEYISKAYIVAAVFGVVFFALFLIAAIKQPKSRGLGIATAIIQLLSAIGSAMYVIGFHKATFFTVVEGTGSTMDEAKNDAAAKLGGAMLDMIASWGPMMIGSLLVLVGWLFGLIYIAKIKAHSLKVLGIFALIFQILRYVFINPIPIHKMFGAGITEEVQASYNMVFFIACALPYIFMFIGVMVGNKQAEAAPAVEAPVFATPIVEAPVVEAPVVEAPVVEANESSDVESAE